MKKKLAITVRAVVMGTVLVIISAFGWLIGIEGQMDCAVLEESINE